MCINFKNRTSKPIQVDCFQGIHSRRSFIFTMKKGVYILKLISVTLRQKFVDKNLVMARKKACALLQQTCQMKRLKKIGVLALHLDKDTLSLTWITFSPHTFSSLTLMAFRSYMIKSDSKRHIPRNSLPHLTNIFYRSRKNESTVVTLSFLGYTVTWSQIIFTTCICNIVQIPAD